MDYKYLLKLQIVIGLGSVVALHHWRMLLQHQHSHDMIITHGVVCHSYTVADARHGGINVKLDTGTLNDHL